MDEQIIFNRIAESDDAAMDELLRRCGGLLRYVISGILRDPQDAEECYNDVCLRLWKAAASFDSSKSSAAAWLTAIARNTALNNLRSRERRTNQLADAPSEDLPSPDTPETQLLKKESAEKLRKAVSSLSSLDRSLFYRKYYYMQPITQIAAELGMSVRAAEGRLYRLRQRLKKLLGGDQP